MDTLLQARDKWKKTVKRLNQDMYRLERQVERLENDKKELIKNYEDRLAQKDVLLCEFDNENQRLRDDINILELEINIINDKVAVPKKEDKMIKRRCC